MKIYLAEDYENFRALLAAALREGGAEVTEFRDAASLLGAALVEPPSVIVADLRLPDLSALYVLECLREAGVGAPAIVMTGEHPQDVRIDAGRHGSVRVIHKPFWIEELRALIAALAESAHGTK